MARYHTLLQEVAPALSSIAAAMARRRRVLLPPVAGLSMPVVARALHRAAVESGSWGPLVLLTAPCPPAVQASLAAAAADGWLASDQPLPDAERRCRLLLADPDAPPLSLSAAARAFVLAQDPHYAVSTDPALRRARSLIAICAEQSEVLTVIGPPGSGRRALVEAAAALAGVSTAGAGAGAGRLAGGWWLLHEAPQLDAATLAPLAARLDRQATPPPPALPGLRPPAAALVPLAGESAALCAALADIVRWAGSGAPVLVRGETGTGKDLAARALHDLSPRRGGPLVTLDPGALSGELAASALFGHVRGAFTGAHRAARGAFARADGGTLFIDELGTLSLSLQARLLRVLESGTIQPLGGEPRQVDVRVVAATSAPLEQRVSAGAFRADLLYRLQGATVWMPPLRERLGDLPLLAGRLLGGAALSDEALRRLGAYRWPGNVRELKNILTSAAQLAGGAPISAAHLSAAGLRPDGPAFLTAREPMEAPPPGLERHHLYQAAALSVRVAPLAERPAASIRHALLSTLSGTPVTAEALALLEGWPWWGGLAELRRVLGLLTRQQRCIDRALLLGLFPRFAAPTRRAPIQALLYPSLLPSGELAGLRSTHRAAALLIGRAPDPLALQRAGDPLSRRRWRWMQDRLEGADAEAVPLPQLPELSRAHLLITRRPGGLVVHRVPETSLAVEVATVGEPPVGLPPGGQREVGPAASLRLLSRTGAPLQVYLFLDLDAEAQARALRGLLAPAGMRVTLQQQARRVWALSPDEVALLNEAVACWAAGGPLGRHVLDHLRARPGAAALLRYIDSPDPTRYCARLYGSSLNSALCADLKPRLSPEQAAALPSAIAKQLR